MLIGIPELRSALQVATYLLVWNPKRHPWESLTEISDRVSAGEIVCDRWSVSNSKRPKVGERCFFIRLGKEPKGIFGSGVVTRNSYSDVHWSDTSRSINYVDIEFSVLLDPSSDNILPLERLKYEIHHNWTPQSSGTTIPLETAWRLEKIWEEFNNLRMRYIPEEIQRIESYTEGSVQTILVNRYERSSRARARCIAEYGYHCFVCGFSFESVYGEQGKNIIHVHHLRPLSEISQEYRVDPVKDLRPICPNCHAFIHSRIPAFSLEEVKLLLRKTMIRRPIEDTDGGV